MKPSAPSTQEILRLNGVGKHFGYVPVLRNIELALSTGDIVCVMGPNGAGKSTLLSLIYSLESPEQGTLALSGTVPRSEDARRRAGAMLGYLGHEPGLFYDLTAEENLEFFAKLFGQTDAARITRLLTEAGLFNRRADFVRLFSRGMKQRLGLARAMLHEPMLLLLDEPLTGLDSAGEVFLLDSLRRHKSRGGAAIIVTHSEEPFVGTATRFLFLLDGAVVADLAAEKYTPAARKRVRELLYTER